MNCSVCDRSPELCQCGRNAQPAGTPSKPFADWTREEVQQWLRTCGFCEKTIKKVRLAGKLLVRRTNEQFTAALGPLEGPALFDEIQGLLSQDQLVMPQTGTALRTTITELSPQLERMSLGEARDQLMARIGPLLTGDLQLRRPHQLKRASEATNAAELGYAMPLVAREESLHQLYRLSFGQFNQWRNRDPQQPDMRKQIRVPTCCGASGIGKTRFSSQAFYYIQERIQAKEAEAEEEVEAEAEAEVEAKWRPPVAVDSAEACFRSALSRCVRAELVLAINTTDEPRQEELASPMISFSLRAIYAYGQRYVPFCAKWPSYYEFFNSFFLQAQAAMLTFSGVLKQIAAWEQLKEEQYLLLVILLDETNLVPIEYINDCVRAVTNCWYLDKSIRVFALPFLSGTNPVDVYKISGEGPMNLQLPLLGVNDYVTILRYLLDEPDFVPSKPIRQLLANLAYNPRLLALGLSAMSVHGHAWQQQEPDELVDSPKGLAPLGLASLPFDLELLRAFLARACGDLSTLAFKTAIANLRHANLLTLDFWLNERRASVRQLVLAHIIFDIEVQLTTKLKGFTVGELINKGVVFLDGGRYLMLPYAYLAVLHRDTSQSSRGHRLPLVFSPTLKLLPHDAELMDIDVLLERLDLHRAVGHLTCKLSQLLRARGMKVENDLVLQVPTVRLAAERAKRRMTIDNAAEEIRTTYSGGRSAWAVINAPQAPSFDAALFLTVAEWEIPRCYSAQHIPAVATDEDAQSAVEELGKMARFKNYRFDRRDKVSTKKNPKDLFAILIQSKRRTTAAAVSMKEIWMEYLKVRGFAVVVPFVLLIITDKAAPVPEALQEQVLVIAEKDLEAYLGRILAGRRRESSSN